jgi:hypothetical protein
MNPFRRMVALLGRVISPTQGLYHTRTQDSTTQKDAAYTYLSSGIRTHDLSSRVVNTHTLDRAATVIRSVLSTP